MTRTCCVQSRKSHSLQKTFLLHGDSRLFHASLIYLHLLSSSLLVYRDRDNSGRHERDISEWINIFGSLQEILQYTASVHLTDEKSSKSDKKRYSRHFKSGTTAQCCKHGGPEKPRRQVLQDAFPNHAFQQTRALISGRRLS